MSLYYPPAQRGGILTDPKYEFFVNIFHLLYLSAKNRRHRHTPSEELAVQLQSVYEMSFDLSQ